MLSVLLISIIGMDTAVFEVFFVNVHFLLQWTDGVADKRLVCLLFENNRDLIFWSSQNPISQIVCVGLKVELVFDADVVIVFSRLEVLELQLLARLQLDVELVAQLLGE